MVVVTNKRGKPIAVQENPNKFLCTSEFLNALQRSDQVQVARGDEMINNLYAVDFYKSTERHIRNVINQQKKKLGIKFISSKEINYG